jgi:endogenous inhibitor of DNA gyrase (YacG/DUF329 family)
MVDLGDWASERYRVPVEDQGPDSQEREPEGEGPA